MNNKLFLGFMLSFTVILMGCADGGLVDQLGNVASISSGATSVAGGGYSEGSTDFNLDAELFLQGASSECTSENSGVLYSFHIISEYDPKTSEGTHTIQTKDACGRIMSNNQSLTEQELYELFGITKYFNFPTANNENISLLTIGESTTSSVAFVPAGSELNPYIRVCEASIAYSVLNKDLYVSGLYYFQKENGQTMAFIKSVYNATENDPMTYSIHQFEPDYFDMIDNADGSSSFNTTVSLFDDGQGFPSTSHGMVCFSTTRFM